jgi:PadR family transcriptional regulator
VTVRKSVGEFEQLVLLAIMRLGDDAYGMRLRREIEDRTGRNVSPGSIYTVLERLESRLLVASELGEPVPGRRGRPRRYYRLTDPGLQSIARSYRSIARMTSGMATKLAAIEIEGH